jgi:predicted dehydrogenase
VSPERDERISGGLPVRIAIVGVNWGERVLRELQSPRWREHIEVVGLAARRAAHAEEVAARYGVPAFAGFDEVLADERVEAVALMVGPDVRHELTLACLRAGKHVMTTKPLDLDADRALTVLHEAESLGLALHLNSPQPVLAPDLLQIEEWVEEHDLGRMISCRGEQWVSYREDADGSWYDDPQLLPVAPIGRLGIYVLNDMVQLFGSPERVLVSHSRIATGRPTPDNALALLGYPEGALCSLFTSLTVDDGEPYRCAMTINFERGTIYRNVGPSDPAPSRDRVRLELATRDPAGAPVRLEAVVAGGSGTYNWQAFIDAVRHPATPLVAGLTPGRLVEPLRTLAALGRAERSGGWEPLTERTTS